MVNFTMKKDIKLSRQKRVKNIMMSMAMRSLEMKNMMKMVIKL